MIGEPRDRMPEADAIDRLRLLRQGAAAEALGITERMLVSEVNAGRLRYVLIGKRRRFKPADLAAYIERQERGCPEQPGDLSSSDGQDRSRGIATSRSTVVDFASALKRRPAQRQKQKLLSCTRTREPAETADPRD